MAWKRGRPAARGELADPTGGAGSTDDHCLVLSFGGVALATVTGWLGGELVSRLGVGVDDGANLNAPSSLQGTAGDRGLACRDHRRSPAAHRRHEAP